MQTRNLRSFFYLNRFGQQLGTQKSQIENVVVEGKGLQVTKSNSRSILPARIFRQASNLLAGAQSMTAPGSDRTVRGGAERRLL
jgi:hypothetical protein